MSGYLQRIAAAAAKPERRVHPFVRPLYEGAIEAEGLRMPMSEVVTERVSARVSEPIAKSEAPPRVREIGRRVVQQANETAHSQMGEAAREQFEALLPQVEAAGEGRAEVTRPYFRDEAAKDGAPERPGWNPRWDNAADGEARKFEPLMVEKRRETDSGDADAPVVREGKDAPNGAPSLVMRESGGKNESLGVSGLRTTAELAAGRRLAQQAMARATQSGDEIQIHIGRIEVTAMPAAVAPRPVPAPARKSQTLDEYLRQRNGRAG